MAEEKEMAAILVFNYLNTGPLLVEPFEYLTFLSGIQMTFEYWTGI